MDRIFYRSFLACWSFILLLGGYVALRYGVYLSADSDRLCTLVVSLLHHQSFSEFSIILCGSLLSMAALVTIWVLNPLRSDPSESLRDRLISL